MGGICTKTNKKRKETQRLKTKKKEKKKERQKERKKNEIKKKVIGGVWSLSFLHGDINERKDQSRSQDKHVQ